MKILGETLISPPPNLAIFHFGPVKLKCEEGVFLSCKFEFSLKTIDKRQFDVKMMILKDL